MRARRIVWVKMAALVALAGVLIHVGAVFGGPSWFAFFGAPPRIVASAQAGTWLAPASAVLIAGIMAVCALYAGSVLGWVRRPPLQKIVLAIIATVCVFRALILPLIALSQSDFRGVFELVSAGVWFLAGVGFLVAFRIAGAAPDKSFERTRER